MRFALGFLASSYSPLRYAPLPTVRGAKYETTTTSARGQVALGTFRATASSLLEF